MQEKLGQLFKNRGSAVIVGLVVAGIAIILLFVYLRSYRSSVNSGKQVERVLIANKLIPRGTSGKLVAEQGLYQVASVQKDQLEPLAISDPAAIQGRLAATDIYAGQQLTQADFTTEGATSLPAQLTGPQRAIAIPVDSAHGLVGEVAAGDYVDVYVGVANSVGNPTGSGAAVSQTILTLLAPDILVLVAPGGGSPNAILRVTTKQVPKFAYAADNARLWLVLRPQVGASQTPPITVSLSSLLAGAGTGKP